MTATADYPYCRFGFAEWNPVQQRCLPYFQKDMNLVVSASVASGKTAVAEAVMGFTLASPGARAVYVCPLKALGSEKYESWRNHETFGKYAMAALDGDHDVPMAALNRARLILATAESMDIRCRKREPWLGDVKTLVLDEAHLLGHAERGACAEAMLMTLTAINPDCRIICLSGTMSNAKEVAAWIGSLNRKSTAYVVSAWRPTRLRRHVEATDSLNGQMEYITEKVKVSCGEKTLIFVHSRRTGKILRDHLRKHGVRCGFYSSELDAGRRERLLRKYRSDAGGLPVLIATSSLAQGVTL